MLFWQEKRFQMNILPLPILRMHSSRMRTALLPTICVVATTRCQYRGGMVQGGTVSGSIQSQEGVWSQMGYGSERVWSWGGYGPRGYGPPVDKQTSVKTSFGGGKH